MCRIVRGALFVGLYLILMCLNGWALGSFKTEAVCHSSGTKVCVTVEQNDYEKWLWFSTSCHSDCVYYHDVFVEQFLPLEHLTHIAHFGINLRKKTDGKLVWSHYKLGSSYKKQALIVEVEVTKQDRFESIGGRQFNHLLLDDLTRLQPVTPEILKRYYTNYDEWIWSGVAYAGTFFSGVIGTMILLIFIG